ncbi:hypothetical protein [Enterovirga sp. CN4-39]|uniref:hypothetical protein n=1 Tax=Enterovirga sp. CN4-39 TaxID=3400910 RepID=UPI003BFE803E
MVDTKDSEPSLGAVLWFGGLALAGLVIAVMAFRALPVAREALAVAEAVAPVYAADEWVREGGGKWGTTTRRRQDIAVAGSGRGYLIVSPPRSLRVPDIDRLPQGIPLRFLIDPERRLIYEARLGERVLLAYAKSAEALRNPALAVLAGSLAVAAAGGFGLWRRRAAFAG